MSPIAFIRNPTSLTIIVDGIPYTVANDHAKYDKLNEALAVADYEAIQKIVVAKRDMAAKIGTFGGVEVYNGHVTYDGKKVDNYVTTKILELVNAEMSPEPLASFLDRVKKNPSKRAVDQLYRWCERSKMPLAADGRVLAYKIVGPDFLDLYTKTFDNSPGNIVEMPRNEVNEDPNVTCSDGLHVCSAEYLPKYGTAVGNRVILVIVDPADFVAVPTDYNLSKARVCRYEVLQELVREEAPQFFDTYFGVGHWDKGLDKAPEPMVAVQDEDGDFYDANGQCFDNPVLMTRIQADAVLDNPSVLGLLKIVAASELADTDRDDT